MPSQMPSSRRPRPLPRGVLVEPVELELVFGSDKHQVGKSPKQSITLIALLSAGVAAEPVPLYGNG